MKRWILSGLAAALPLIFALAPLRLQAAPPAAASAATIPPSGLAEFWGEHPVLAQTRRAGLWDEPALQWLVDAGMPLDRIWALAETLPPAQLRRQRIGPWLTGRLVALAAVGPSGALRPRDVRVADLSAGQALALGWVRLLSLDTGAALPASAANRSGNARVLDAGPLDLLDRAAQAAPNEQAAVTAVALAEAVLASGVPPDARCPARRALWEAARSPRQAALPAGVALKLQRWAAADARCGLAAPSTPPDWPAPAAWPTAPAAPTPQRPPPAPSGPDGHTHRFGEAFALTAPFFKGWLADPLVAAVVQRKRLDPAALAEALRADASGDRAVVVLNAALHLSGGAAWDLAQLCWEALRLRHPDWPQTPAASTAPLSQLDGAEALALGYARALAADWSRPEPTQPSVANARAQELLAHARSLAKIDGLWALVAWQLLQIDLLRERDPCGAATRAAALRGVLAKSEKMPDAAKASIAQALQTLERRCPAAPAQP